MYLSYLKLSLIVIACLTIGGIATYYALKRQIRLLKNSMHSLDASLKGMWDINDQWQKKYTALEKNKQTNEVEMTEQLILAKHASDDSKALKERAS